MKKLYHLIFIFLILFSHNACSTTNSNSSKNVGYDQILYPLRIENSYGFIKSDGVLVVTPRFNEAYQSTCGIAVGVNEEGTFYLDFQGNVLFSTESTALHARRFSDYLVAKCINEGQDNEKWGYVNRNGNWVIEPIYSIAGDFSEGLANVSYSNREESFYIDKENIPVFKNEKYIGAEFKNGYAQVWEKNVDEILVKREYGMERITPRASGIISKNGELIIPYIFRTTTNYSDSLFCFNYFNLDKILKDERSFFGYMNIDQEVVIEPQYWLAYDFHEGLAVVSIDGSNYGMINKKGEYIIPPEYKYLSEFSNELICFSKDGISYGFMNKDGEIKISATFSYGTAFNGPLALISKKGISGYVNKTGEYFLATDYKNLPPE